MFWITAVWLIWTFEVNYKMFVFKFASVIRCLKNERFHWTDALFCRFCKKLLRSNRRPNDVRVDTYDVRVVTRCLRTFFALYFPSTKLMYFKILSKIFRAKSRQLTSSSNRPCPKTKWTDQNTHSYLQKKRKIPRWTEILLINASATGRFKCNIF